MKKFLTKFLAWIILGVIFLSFVPALVTRVQNEQGNKNVSVSLLYNDLRNKVSDEKLSEMLEKFLDAGVNKITVMEDDVNALVARGDITCIKFNTLRHKYDEESMIIADKIEANHPEVSYDSYLLMVKRDYAREKLAKLIPMKYTSLDYVKISEVTDMDIYAFFNGREELWNMTMGFDEKKIEELHNMGFEIVLSFKPKNYSKLEYLEHIDSIVKKYDVEYFNLKVSNKEYSDKESIKKNYTGIADILVNNDMTLVVTEEASQLSNQKFFGFDYIFDKVMGKDGSKKVVRSYETYDDSHADDTGYKYRAQQFFNSVVDRNIRFITITQQAPIVYTFDEGADKTLMATKMFIQDIKDAGYEVNGETTPFDYDVNRRFNYGLAAAAVVMMLYLAFSMVFGKEKTGLLIAAVIVAILGFLATYAMPKGLLLLYPTVFCLAVSCFAMTVVLKFVKNYAEKMNTLLGIISTVALMIAVLCIGVIGMCTLLSGVDFYINNEIFRGIKMTLMLPIAYTAVIYYFIFMKKDNIFMGLDFKKALFAEIKVYWVLIAGAILMVGYYYILRSGNVNTISALETAMRTAITEAFPARPRTKEFLIGYPCLVLFFYYVKHHDIKLIQWVLAIGASILAASVTNTFCHVFADASVMYMRVVNGILIGAVVSVFAYVANLVLVRIVRILIKKFKLNELFKAEKNTEME
ncbi:MAG: hypothetical protein IJD97_08940 [Clostridia bacterium]|nr:hypothetical protein [Clostridia bacterium]